MRISGVETRLYRIPPAVQIEDSIQRISHWEFVVSTVTTDAGISGTGFAYTLGIGGTAVRELVDTYLSPLVLGHDPMDVERIWARCWWELHALGSAGMTRFALAAIDIALWDILAKHAGVPLYRLLGGSRDRILAYGSGINMHLDGEPLLADDRAGHVHVRQATGIPIAVGETLYTRYEFADYMRAGAVDVVQADIPRVGGFTEWMKIARLAEAFNLPVAPHFMMELSVHALCAVPNGLILEDLQGGSLTDLGILAEPIRVENGEIAPPARQGHGIVFDRAALSRYEVTGKVTGVTPTRT